MAKNSHGRETGHEIMDKGGVGGNGSQRIWSCLQPWYETSKLWEHKRKIDGMDIGALTTDTGHKL